MVVFFNTIFNLSKLLNLQFYLIIDEPTIGRNSQCCCNKIKDDRHFYIVIIEVSFRFFSNNPELKISSSTNTISNCYEESKKRIPTTIRTFVIPADPNRITTKRQRGSS